MEFYTQWKRPPRKQEIFMNKMQPVYKKRTNTKTGKKEIYVEKEIDIYEKIQEYKDEVSLTKLLQQYNLDPLKQLKDQEAKIVDITNIPQNLMEMMNEIEKADQIWNKLSKDTKLKFGNDKNEFLAASENGKLAQMLHDEIKTNPNRFTQAQVINRYPEQTQVLPGQVSVEQYQQMTTPQQNVQQVNQQMNNNGGNL